MGTGRPLRGTYQEALQDLQETEALLGEVASLLSAVADALTENPGRIVAERGSGPDDLVLSPGDWPTCQTVFDLRRKWVDQYRRAVEIWADLEESERDTLAAPCAVGGNKLMPVV